MFRMLKFSALTVFLTFAVSLQGQIDSLYQNLEFSLLTCRSGDQLYSTFGHTAIRMQNTLNGSDIVFNYGTFDTDAPYFYIKFLRGQLPYKLSQSSYIRFLKEYQYFKRSVIEQKLYLTGSEKKVLGEALLENIKPENATYPYDFFYDNCTTRAIDIIKKATGKLDYKNDIADITYREMLKQNLGGMPWSEFGIDLIIGAKADRKTNRSQQHFLPMYLHDDLNEATRLIEKSRFNVATTDRTILDFDNLDSERKQKKPTYPLYVIIGFLILELVLVLGRQVRILKVYDKIWYILLAVMGFVMAFMWWGTEHKATNDNYNLIWANLAFIPFLMIKNRGIKLVLAGIIIACSCVAIANTLVQFLPQYFHAAFAVISLISVLKLGRYIYSELYSAQRDMT